jgi:hypothetical protein
VLLRAHVAIKRVGGDDRCKNSEEHLRLLVFAALGSVTGAPDDPQIAPQPLIGSALCPDRAPGLCQLRECAIALSRRPLQRQALIAHRLLCGAQAHLGRARLVALVVAHDAADRRTSRDQAHRSQDSREGDAWLFPQAAHHTSCSPIASPSCLIAIRVRRCSASSV